MIRIWIVGLTNNLIPVEFYSWSWGFSLSFPIIMLKFIKFLSFYIIGLRFILHMKFWIPTHIAKARYIRATFIQFDTIFGKQILEQLPECHFVPIL